MMAKFGWVIVVLLGLTAVVDSSAESTWEFLGPGMGQRPDAFFVTDEALYLGLSEEDGAGQGLHRYAFTEERWELFAWGEYRIPGVVVWGESDENLLVIRYDIENERSDILRTTDSGSSWIPIEQGLPTLHYYAEGLRQAPSDTSRLIIWGAFRYSTNGGWSWNQSAGTLPWINVIWAAFNPENPLIAYGTGESAVFEAAVYRSSDGGANWCPLAFGGQPWGVDVEWQNTDHVMKATCVGGVYVTTNDGGKWSCPSAPLSRKEVLSPPWWPSGFFVGGTDSAWTSYEVWWTGDLGTTWTSYSHGLPDLPGSLFSSQVLLGAHPIEPILFAALSGSGVWRLDFSATSVPELEDPSIGQNLQLLPYPNPSTGGLSISVRRNAGPMMGSLRVLDVAGGVVATLHRGELANGAVLRWNGRAQSGREVTSGVYRIAWIGEGERVGGSRPILVLR